MNGRKFYSYLFIWLCVCSLTVNSLAQTITTGSITPSTICPGGTVTITFTTSGTFAASNTFSAQLSDAAGTFSASPPVIGSVASTSAVAISATIPTSTSNGSYKIRVVSSATAVIGSSQALTVNVPAAPTATSPSPYCQGAPATVLTASGQGLKWYDASNTLLNGAPTPNTNTPGTTTYYVTQSVGSCESARTTIQVVVNASPTAPATTTAPTYCQNKPASALIATPSTGASLIWYGLTGVASTTAPVPSTSQAGIFSYSVSQTLNGCEGPRATIAVTVNSTPGSPSVAPISFCQNGPASPLTAIPSQGGTLNWYGTDATGGTASSTAPTPPTSATGTIIYYVSQSVNGCEGPRTSLVVTINTLPSAPTATAPGPYCQFFQPTVLTATGQNLLWYGTNATGGTGSPTAPQPATNVPGSITYYVTQTINGCESARIGITVDTKPTPSVPSVSAVEFCQNSTPPVITATLATNATPNWYGTNATGGTATVTAPVPPNTVPQTIVYYVSQTLNGCESPRASLSVRIKGLPAAPSVAAIGFCNNGPASQLIANGQGLKWYDAADNPLSVAPTPGTGTVGDQLFKVSQTVDGCEGPKASLVVTIKPLPAAPIGITPGSYCQFTNPASLSANGQSLLWYGPNATGGTASTVATVPSTTTSGTTTYYVTQTINGCESSRTGINVSVKPKPGLPGTSAVAFCQNSPSPSLVAVFAANTSPNWYGTNATGGSATATAPIPPNNVAQTIVYYVSQTLDGCESDRSSLSVRIKPLPAAPTVTAVSFCNTSAASPLTASGNELKWYDGTGNLLGGAPTPNTGTVGNQTFRVSQTLESCEGPKADLVVTIKPLPDAPGISNLTYCLPTQDQPAQNVAALTAAGQNLKWFNSSDGNQFPNAPIPSIGQLGTQNFQVSQTVNGCEGGKSTLQVTVRTTAVPTVSKPLVTYCINDKTVPLEASAESGGSLRWVNPYGQISNDAPTPYTLNTSIQAGGDPFYVFQVGQNTCYSERSVIKVLVNALPTLSLIPSANSVNLGQRVNLNLKFTSTAPYSYTLTDGLSGISNKADTTISVLPRATTTYQVTTIKNSCGVGLPGNPATATVVVRVPTVTTNILTTSTLCVGTSLSVPFTTTGEFNQGNAFRIELVSVADTTKKYGIPATAAVSPVTAPLPLTLVGGQYYVRIKADNPEIAIVGSNSPTLLTVRPQPSASLTGTQNIYEGYPASLTLALGGESPWTVIYADSVRSYTTTATASPYAVEVRPTRTTTYRLVSISNVCGNGPISGTATVSVLPLLGVDDNPLDPLVKTYPIPTTSVLTIELDLPLTRDPASLSLSDMSGRQVLQQTTRKRKQDLDLTSQPNGLYLLRIQVGDRQTVRKILKQ